MSPKREMSASCRIDLDAVVKDLKGLRKSSLTVNSAKGMPLLEVFAEEAKFLRDSGVKPSSVVSVLMNNLGLPPHGPIGQAALLTSLRAEEDMDAPDYHNQHHVVEVVVAAYILGRREKLPIYRIAELIIAAAAHDLGHTGQRNQHNYERESYSFQIAQPIFQQAGLPPENIQRLEQMILATDFRVGVPPARQSYLDTRSLPPNDEQRLLATQCLLLTEADVLFSCFDFNYNEFLSQLLSAELKKHGSDLSLQERIGFLSYVRFLSDAAAQLGLEERRLKLLEDLSKIHETGSHEISR